MYIHKCIYINVSCRYIYTENICLHVHVCAFKCMLKPAKITLKCENTRTANAFEYCSWFGHSENLHF